MCKLFDRLLAGSGEGMLAVPAGRVDNITTLVGPLHNKVHDFYDVLSAVQLTRGEVTYEQVSCTAFVLEIEGELFSTLIHLMANAGFFPRVDRQKHVFTLDTSLISEDEAEDEPGRKAVCEEIDLAVEKFVNQCKQTHPAEFAQHLDDLSEALTWSQPKVDLSSPYLFAQGRGRSL